MRIVYKTKKLEKSLTDEKELIRKYGQRAKKIKQRRKELEAAENLFIFSKIPQARLHPYSGDRSGEWSVDILKNWRLFIEISQNPIPVFEDGSIDLAKVTTIEIISVEDPH